MTTAPRSCFWLVAALMLGAASTSAAQTVGIGVVVTPAPMHLEPDSARPPVTTVPAGTSVRVLARQGDWLWIVFRDPALGDRVGYVPAAAVRVDSMPTTRVTPIPLQRSDRGYLWLSGTYQNKSTAFTAVTSFTQNGDPGAITTAYDGVEPVVTDVAIGGLIWNGLGIQIAGTWAGQITDATISGSVSGRATEINRQELGFHVDASWSVPAIPSRAQVVVFAGPSLFRVKQGLVTGIAANGSATVVESTRQHIGANGGVEASVRVYKALGLGGLVRFSRADVPFTPAPGVDVTIRAGGVQAGGGLHFRF